MGVLILLATSTKTFIYDNYWKEIVEELYGVVLNQHLEYSFILGESGVLDLGRYVHSLLRCDEPKYTQ